MVDPNPAAAEIGDPRAGPNRAWCRPVDTASAKEAAAARARLHTLEV